MALQTAHWIRMAVVDWMDKVDEDRPFRALAISESAYCPMVKTQIQPVNSPAAMHVRWAIMRHSCRTPAHVPSPSLSGR